MPLLGPGRKGGARSSSSSQRYFFPRTIRQEEYASLLRSSVASYDTPDIIVASGPAGTCKTLAATLVGVEKLMSGEVERLVLTRPAVSADESLGFLPGTLEDKMHVWLLPIFDVLRAGMKPRELERMMSSDAVEICSLSHMRGRTFHDSYVIVDECQNTTPAQMLMLMTRIGAGSRMVFTGDPMQHDRRPSSSVGDGGGNGASGLSDLLRRMNAVDADGTSTSSGLGPENAHSPPTSAATSCIGGGTGGGVIRVFEFDSADIQRHRAISHVLALYES